MWPREEIQCLISLGTGRYYPHTRQNYADSGLKSKINKLIASATDVEAVHTVLQARTRREGGREEGREEGRKGGRKGGRKEGRQTQTEVGMWVGRKADTDVEAVHTVLQVRTKREGASKHAWKEGKEEGTQRRRGSSYGFTGGNW